MKRVQLLPMLALTGMIVACASAPNVTTAGSAQPAPGTSNELALRQNMRELWADHVVWTRAYIVAAVAGDASSASALDRLMKNQEDLGNAIAPYYGAPAGARLTQLLKEHISVAG